MMVDEDLALLRGHRSNITRYQRLLKTELTKFELAFIERRVSEERSAMEKLAVSAFPLTFQTPSRAMGHATTRLAASRHG
jgi:hypothetical protein